MTSFIRIKGKPINIARTACRGQQNTKRIPGGYNNRALPHFTNYVYQSMDVKTHLSVFHTEFFFTWGRRSYWYSCKDIWDEVISSLLRLEDSKICKLSVRNVRKHYPVSLAGGGLPRLTRLSISTQWQRLSVTTVWK